MVQPATIYHEFFTSHKPKQDYADRARDQEHQNRQQVPADPEKHQNHGPSDRRQQKHRRSITRRHGQDNNSEKAQPRSERRRKNLYTEPPEILLLPPDTEKRKSKPREKVVRIT